MPSRRKPVLLQVRDAEGGSLSTTRADSLKRAAKPQHARLTDAQAERSDQLFRRIGHWFKPTPVAWGEGFLYDLHPEAEIRVWEHIADVVDALWVAEPKVLAKLNRSRLARLVVAVSTRVVDIPSQMSDVTDEMVDAVKRAFFEGSLDDEDLPPAGWPDRITVDADMMFGKPCIRGLRYPVDFVLELLDSGMSRDEILADYEDLEAADLDAALAYASGQGSIRRAQMAIA